MFNIYACRTPQLTNICFKIHLSLKKKSPYQSITYQKLNKGSFQISSKKFHKIQSILARYIYQDMVNIDIYHIRVTKRNKMLILTMIYHIISLNKK